MKRGTSPPAPTNGTTDPEASNSTTARATAMAAAANRARLGFTNGTRCRLTCGILDEAAVRNNACVPGTEEEQSAKRDERSRGDREDGLTSMGARQRRLGETWGAPESPDGDTTASAGKGVMEVRKRLSQRGEVRSGR
jgi:hypothetical protein